MKLHSKWTNPADISVRRKYHVLTTILLYKWIDDPHDWNGRIFEMWNKGPFFKTMMIISPLLKGFGTPPNHACYAIGWLDLSFLKNLWSTKRALYWAGIFFPFFILYCSSSRAVRPKIRPLLPAWSTFIWEVICEHLMFSDRCFVDSCWKFHQPKPKHRYHLYTNKLYEVVFFQVLPVRSKLQKKQSKSFFAVELHLEILHIYLYINGWSLWYNY